jgi:hypothetical protein
MVPDVDFSVVFDRLRSASLRMVATDVGYRRKALRSDKLREGCLLIAMKSVGPSSAERRLA